MLYYAYGSNCSKDRMDTRKVDYVLRCKGIIKDYKLVFNKEASSTTYSSEGSYVPKVYVAGSTEIHSASTGVYVSKQIKKRPEFREPTEGYANIVPSEGDVVYGALYVVEADGIEKLDRAEGVSTNHYTRKIMKVTTEYGIEVDAVVYVAHEDKVSTNLIPSKTYLDHILKGKDVMPEEYYKILAATKTLPPVTRTNHYNGYNYNGYNNYNGHNYNNSNNRSTGRQRAHGKNNSNLDDMSRVNEQTGKREKWCNDEKNGWGWYEVSGK